MAATLRTLCALLAFALAHAAMAQTYPSQPIRLIAPFPPGGSVDIIARFIAEPLSTQLGTRILIDNRSGASGNIGMEAAARAAPDGYTIVLNTIPLATSPSLFDKLGWDPVRDFAPIGMVATSPRHEFPDAGIHAAAHQGGHAARAGSHRHRANPASAGGADPARSRPQGLLALSKRSSPRRRKRAGSSRAK